MFDRWRRPSKPWTVPLPVLLWALKRMKRRERFRSENALLAAVAHDRRTVQADPPASFRHRFHIHDTWQHGLRCFTMMPHQVRHPAHITYVHGGGHVCEMSVYHWRLLAQLVTRVGCTVHVPIYPLSPEHDHRPAFTLLRQLYADQIQQHGAQQCIWMGDSSGGGLALAITQAAVAQGLPAVRDLILISPWLDLTQSDPQLPQLAAQDPWLDLPGMNAAAQWWAGGDALDLPHISPLYGPLQGLQRLSLFMGTRDLLHPACLALHQRALSAGVDSHLHEGQGEIHVWPLLPLASAQTAIDRMIQVIMQPRLTNTP